MSESRLPVILMMLAVALMSAGAQAVNIDLVTVGNPGNAADTRYASYYNPPHGAVAYAYQIGKFDVTSSQYCAFLNAVASTDTYGLYTSLMGGTWGCGIQQSGSPGNYTYSVAADWANRPANWVSWGRAVRFANWLANGQPTGPQGPSTTEDGSYFLNGANSDWALGAVTRKAGAIWVIPSEDEWYKAAYYDPNKPGGAGYWDYATRTNAIPTNVLDPNGTNNANYYDWYSVKHGNGTYSIGPPYYLTEVGAFASSPSAYGTFDQSGNVYQWNEAFNARGGSFADPYNFLVANNKLSAGPTYADSVTGFRVAYVPEPATLGLMALGVLAILRRKRA